MAGFFQDIVMEQAMKDRLAHIARVDTPDAAPPQLDISGPQDMGPGEVESPKSDGSGEDDLEVIRARRLAELRRRTEVEGKFQGLGHGVYTEIVESEFLDSVIKSPRAVVHFYHNDFERCKAVDKNLRQVAPSLIGIRFLRINAEKCPFFVDKLKIRVLPTILYFVDGKTVHTVTGFGEFGGTDDFAVPEFIKSLKTNNMLVDSRPSAYQHWLAAAKPRNRREAVSDSD